MSKVTFDLIPAIDILDGKCVRLTLGDYSNVEEFSSNPEEMAKKWVDLGAKRIHVVDLNGAKEGYPVNFKIICDLIKKLPNIKVQVGGGIRTTDLVENYLNEGVSFIVLGTRIFKDRLFLGEVVKKFQENIIVGLDLKNNKIALSGWKETTDLNVEELKKSMSVIKQMVYTDVTKDGTLTGPDLGRLEVVASSFSSNIIVSGGISSIDDIMEILSLKQLKCPNISGVILGKSLYKGRVNLKDAIQTVASKLTKADFDPSID
jgi:phosphoribosylformimino-5-aminoimidazole carboxamide ribotide isomerase